MHSDNLIRLLKLPVWERLDFPESFYIKLFLNGTERCTRIFYAKGKNHEKKIKIDKTNK